jgi:hypothetical protein
MVGGCRRQRAGVAAAELGGLHALDRRDEGPDIVTVLEGQAVHDPHRHRRHATSLDLCRSSGVASFAQPGRESVSLSSERLRRDRGEGGERFVEACHQAVPSQSGTTLRPWCPSSRLTDSHVHAAGCLEQARDASSCWWALSLHGAFIGAGGELWRRRRCRELTRRGRLTPRLLRLLQRRAPV